MSFVQIPGKPKPKNGIFYTIDELKEHGAYNFNLDGKEKQPRKSKETSPKPTETIASTPSRNPIVIPSTPNSSKKASSTIKQDKKTPKKPKTTTPPKEKITKKRKSIQVKSTDKISWMTKKSGRGFRRVMYYNGQEKRGQAAHKIWEEWKKLQDQETKTSPKKSKSDQSKSDSVKMTDYFAKKSDSDEEVDYLPEDEEDIEIISSGEESNDDDDDDDLADLNNSVEILE